MRSQLTRTIFRRLLSPEPILFRPCHRRRQHVLPRAPQLQRRTLFGFSAKQVKEPRDPQLDPGLRKLIDLTTMEKMHARPPPRQELVAGWRTFFGYKEGRGEAVMNWEAVHALRCFKHLAKREGEDEEERLGLGDLRIAAKALTRMPNDKRDTHNELARELYAEIVRLVEDTDGSDGHAKSPKAFADLGSYTEVLVGSGSTLEAKNVILEVFQKRDEGVSPRGTDQRAKNWRRSWLRFIKPLMGGFSQESNEGELLKMVQLAESIGLSYDATMHLILTNFYATRDDIEATKKWFSKPVNQYGTDPSPETTPESLSIILRFCIRNNELEWCKTIFRSLLEKPISKSKWDIIFQWAAGALGKGVEDVERMMEVMKRVNSGDPELRPNVATINGLVSLAVSLNDPYLAERYIMLGRKHGILPNAETFIHQLSYRVSAGDLTGAQVAYEALQSEEVMANADLPAINKYIRALCAASTPNYDLITSICADLEERDGRLEATTVSALGLLYLDRGEIIELTDTLQNQSYHYSITERASIRDAFLAYTLDPATPTARAWDSYTIFRQIFEETPIEIRTQAMNEFFRRERSDMALHAFGHMRAHIRSDMRPVLSTYVQCFEGIASCADNESLHVVHNMLKMDSSIEPNTLLYNSLMLAYAACGESDKALDFWVNITNSSEGPSYRSLEIVFRACQRKPFGDKKAREIWSQMRRMEIEVTKNVFVAYVGALAGQGQIEDVKALVESSAKDFNFKPDVQILGTLYNALPGQNRKDLVEEWAKDIYPDAWGELVKLGQIKAKEGHRLFNMPKLAMKA